MEKLGPGAAASGFVSRNNSDPTAPKILRFMGEAGINRSLICLSNLIPDSNGTIKFKASESKSGDKALGELLSLLPYLESVVLVGKEAQKAQPFFEEQNLRTICPFHPSAQVRATYPDKWLAIPHEWAKVFAA
jgi:hypothetical protein